MDELYLVTYPMQITGGFTNPLTIRGMSHQVYMYNYVYIYIDLLYIYIILYMVMSQNPGPLGSLE